jgi:pre-mRNA-processing factor 39
MGFSRTRLILREQVYERGVASIGVSVDIWANYCAFKVETSHDADVIRE